MSDNEKKLKPMFVAGQQLSNAMMALHSAMENADTAIVEAIHAANAATEAMISETEGDFLRGDAGEILRRLTVMTSYKYEARAIHGLMSDALREHGFELPVVLTRGPGGGR